MMGITETIAKDEDDYIDVAARLGQDRNFYLKIKQFVLKNQSKLYEDTACILALEDFYKRVAYQGKQSAAYNNWSAPDQSA